MFNWHWGFCSVMQSTCSSIKAIIDWPDCLRGFCREAAAAWLSVNMCIGGTPELGIATVLLLGPWPLAQLRIHYIAPGFRDVDAPLCWLTY